MQSARAVLPEGNPTSSFETTGVRGKRQFAEDWASGGFVNEMRPEFLDVPSPLVHGHTLSFDYRIGAYAIHVAT